jgi:hypothetical protein
MMRHLLLTDGVHDVLACGATEGPWTCEIAEVTCPDCRKKLSTEMRALLDRAKMVTD